MKICLQCGERFNSDSWVCTSCSYTPEIAQGYPVFAKNLTKETESYNNEIYCDLAANDVETFFWTCARNSLIIYALNRYFPSTSSFFEIGCGAGYVLSAIEKSCPQIALYGSDALCDGLDNVKSRLKNVELFQMDARNIPFENEFDIVGAFDVLEHIRDDKAVLTSMYRAVKQGGGIIITVPQHPFLWGKSDDYACHVRRYTFKELEDKVIHAGFDIIRMTSFMSFLMPLLMILRLGVGKKDNYDPVSEYKINPVLNNILKNVMNVERSFIRLGFPFPWGSSLLVIAQKR